MSQSLFQISDDIIMLRNQLEVENEFDIDSEERKAIDEQIEIKQEELAHKVENYIYVISQVEAQAEMGTKELQRIQQFIERKQNIANRLKASLLQALLYFGEDDNGVRRLEIGTHKLSTRRSQCTQINEPAEVPEELKLVDVTFKNLSVDISKFLERRINELPDSAGKTALLEKIQSTEKIPLTQVKKYLEENPIEPPELEEGVLNEEAVTFVPWGEIKTNYSLVIK